MHTAEANHNSPLSRLSLRDNAIVFLQQSVWNDLEENEEELCRKWKCKRLAAAVLFELRGMELEGKIIRHRTGDKVVLFTLPWEEFLSDAEWGLSDLAIVYSPKRLGVIEIPPLVSEKDSPWSFDQYILKIANPSGSFGDFIAEMREYYARDERLPQFDSFERLNDFLSWRSRNYCEHHSAVARVVWNRFVKWQRRRSATHADFESGGQGFESLPARQ